MPLAPELKEILACPRCKGALEFHDDEGEICCLACRLAFRIEGDIPALLVEEARTLGAPSPPARSP
jgi:hypothetical protein